MIVQKIPSFIDKLRHDGPSEAFGAAFEYLAGDVYSHLFLPQISRLRLQVAYGDAAPKPWTLLNISPKEIEYLLVPPYWNDGISYTNIDVRSGDWDRPEEDLTINVSRHKIDSRAAIPFRTDRYGWYNSVKQRVQEGVAWCETSAYDYFESAYSEERARQKGEHIDRLCESIRSNGYRAPSELDRSDPDYAPGFRHPNYNTIIVDIGRDGSFIFEDGKNRACLAKVLDVETVPVRVLVRHEKWQEVREEVHAAETVDELSDRAKRHLDHPDIRPFAFDLQGVADDRSQLIKGRDSSREPPVHSV